METYKDITLFIETHFEKLKKYFGLKWRRAPTHSAVWKIITAIEPEALESAFLSYVESAKEEKEDTAYKHYSFAGKALRRP